ncbi:hypothetical protein L208DRAFT_1301875 [Tricholoma matsutake]|nr:hypothetical protein L208DRAFT_1301875 [Tricholoma matsutake 945]
MSVLSHIDVAHSQDASSALSDSETVTISPGSSTFANVEYGDSSEFPSVIPTEHAARTLILCFDGTGDQFDSDNSNIVEFFSMLKRDDSDKQMVYYQAGIGTYNSPQVATPFAARISKLLDEAIAWHLDGHVMDGYEFLMQNYKAGDRICIFGFSRGAYIARGLAGMIHKVGLLPACNYQQVPFAYKMFTRIDEVGWQQSNAFKKAFSVDVPIEFLGVWDTVNSVGLIPRRLPFTTSNTIVRTFRHALSLDERRAKFKANLWNRPNTVEAKLGVEGQKPQKPNNPKPNGHSKFRQPNLRAMEKKYSGSSGKPTDIEEVWFAGCHCDIGGGSVENDVPHSLARIPLRWMVRECFKSNTGIMFTSEGLRGIGLDPARLYPEVLGRPPPLPISDVHLQHVPPAKTPKVDHPQQVVKIEEEHELLDMISPIYDQLRLVWGWWILELLPIKQHFQRSDNTWGATFGWNLGGGRFIPKQTKTKIKVHRTVKMRMEARYPDGEKYVPAASFDLAVAHGNVEWVD